MYSLKLVGEEDCYDDDSCDDATIRSIHLPVTTYGYYLSTCSVTNSPSQNVTIKMDIEGAEFEVLGELSI